MKLIKVMRIIGFLILVSLTLSCELTLVFDGGDHPEGAPLWFSGITWDLIIDSEEKLALLAEGSTQYPYVLIRPGSYTLDGPLDLASHGVHVLTGSDNHAVTLTVEYDLSGMSILTSGEDTTYLGNLSICFCSSTPPATTETIVIDVTGSKDLLLENIHIREFRGTCTGIRGGSGTAGVQSGETICRNIHVDDCHVGFSNLMRLSDCVAYQNSGNGFEDCIYIDRAFSTCNGSAGFYECQIISSSRATDNQGPGFDGGQERVGRIDSSFSNDNLYGFYRCQYVCSSTARGNRIDWLDCAAVAGSAEGQ